MAASRFIKEARDRHREAMKNSDEECGQAQPYASLGLWKKLKASGRLLKVIRTAVGEGRCCALSVSPLTLGH